MEEKKETKRIVPDEIIEFTFYVDGKEIAVLNNKALKQDEDILMLAKIEFDGKDYNLKSLDDEEYKSAIKMYKKILRLTEEEENG